jgi:hypothetical protein
MCVREWVSACVRACVRQVLNQRQPLRFYYVSGNVQVALGLTHGACGIPC